MPESGKVLLVFHLTINRLANHEPQLRVQHRNGRKRGHRPSLQLTCSTRHQQVRETNGTHYICAVNDVLNNPVWGALTSGDVALSSGTATAKFFDERISPFAGFEEGYKSGFDELHALLPPGRTILYATPSPISPPDGWQLLHTVPGLQFVYKGGAATMPPGYSLVPLGEEHTAQMLELTALTKPGPFGPRTIDFGHYFGIFEGDQLVAMTGQRLHVHGYTEISAVCTHPGHLGKGYAASLVQHAVQLIVQQDKTPFLHVRADNHRAITLYERLGFAVSRPMNFYVLKRGD